MRTSDTVSLVVCAILVVIWVALGVATVSDKAWKKDAVQRGFAEYSQTTGNWQWKESKTSKAGE
jgi:hypothetical protein